MHVEAPTRPGDPIDDEDESERDRDDTPDTPPTEPEPIPITEPPSPPGKRGPVIVSGAWINLEHLSTRSTRAIFRRV